ncbi:MAG: metallophosphoesterase, partial [Deinococcota bacterium]
MSYVIGDIHGSDALLERLLDKLLPTSEKLIFLGDYVNKGP